MSNPQRALVVGLHGREAEAATELEPSSDKRLLVFLALHSHRCSDQLYCSFLQVTSHSAAVGNFNYPARNRESRLVHVNSSQREG